MKRLLAVLTVAGALSGCGPVKSTSHLLDAEVQIQAARTAGAEKLAPYEWTAANLYIHKAREEVSFSDYQSGVDFAEKASRYANEAREKALLVANENVDNATPTITVPGNVPVDASGAPLSPSP